MKKRIFSTPVWCFLVGVSPVCELVFVRLRRCESFTAPVISAFHLQFFFLAFFGKGTYEMRESFQGYSSPSFSERGDFFQEHFLFETNGCVGLKFE